MICNVFGRTVVSLEAQLDFDFRRRKNGLRCIWQENLSLGAQLGFAYRFWIQKSPKLVLKKVLKKVTLLKKVLKTNKFTQKSTQKSKFTQKSAQDK